MDSNDNSLNRLIKDIKESIIDVGNHIRSVSSVVKGLHKNSVSSENLFDVSTGVFDGLNNYYHPNRHPDLCSSLTSALKDFKNFVSFDCMLYAECLKGLHTFETAYNAEVIKLKLITKDHLKRRKKMLISFQDLKKKHSKLKNTISMTAINKEIYKLDQDIAIQRTQYIEKILEIENSIFTKMFSVFSEFHFSKAIQSKKFIDLHQSRSCIWTKLALQNVLSKDRSEYIIKNPLKCLNTGSKRPQAPNDCDNLTPNSNDAESLDESSLCIVWSSFFSALESCLPLNPGDVIKPTRNSSQGGWSYGTNRTTNRVGWYPVSHVKPFNELKSYMLSIRDQVF